MDLKAIQTALKAAKVDGWLLCDQIHHGIHPVPHGDHGQTAGVSLQGSYAEALSGGW